MSTTPNLLTLETPQLARLTEREFRAGLAEMPDNGLQRFAAMRRLSREQENHVVAALKAKNLAIPERLQSADTGNRSKVLWIGACFVMPIIGFIVVKLLQQ